MSNTQQQKSSNTLKRRFPGWDEAIAKVEEELGQMKEYVSWLRSAQWALKRCRDSGVQWPGSIQAMMDEFDAGVAAKQGSHRRKAKAA